MLYRYAAKTKDGLQTRKGEVDAPNQRLARQLLQDSGLIVFSLVPARKSGSLNDIVSNIFGITLTDKVRFTEQLGSMVVASLPLTKALDLLITQTKNPKMVDLVKEALKDVESGKPLSFTLDKHKDTFEKSYISLVKAGEASGKLGLMLQKLAHSLEKRRQFVSKVKGALIYPTIVIIAMIAVFVIVLLFVIPKLSDMYLALGVELPFATKAMIAMSDFMVNYSYIVAAITAGAIYLLKAFKSTITGRYFFASMALKLPVFGNLNKQASVVLFCSTLSLLLEAGVPIIEALDIIKNITGNIYYDDATVNIIEDVKKGFPISMAISKEDIFPHLVSQMAVVGEETGTVSTRFENLAIYYEGEVDKIVKNLSTAMEPMIIVVLGAMVSVLMFAVITPIYSLISDL